jgi:hypothetical protein
MSGCMKSWLSEELCPNEIDSVIHYMETHSQEQPVFYHRGLFARMFCLFLK